MSIKIIKSNNNKHYSKSKLKTNSRDVFAKTMVIKHQRMKLNKKKKFSINPWGIDNTNYVFLDFRIMKMLTKSIYQLALIKVVRGKIVKSYHTLIKPIFNKFNFYYFNCILNSQIALSLDFKTLWPEIKQFFDEDTIVITNNFSNMNVLKTLIEYYDLKCSNFNYLCWKQLFSKTYNYDNYTVNSIAHCNDLKVKHHNLLSDVITLQKLVNLHFSKNYHFKTLCTNLNIKFNKLFS